MKDLIDRQMALDAIGEKPFALTGGEYELGLQNQWERDVDAIKILQPAQSEYEELTPEEAASEIASGSTMSAWYWLDDMIRLKQMGYAICRKR